MTVSAPVKIFYSYAHKDEELCAELIVALKGLERRGRIEGWFDRNLRPGDDWAGAIDQKLEEADIILLLISKYFVASNYCWNIEMTRALQRAQAKEAIVIPISLRRYSWEGLPFAKLQALPKGAVPVEDREVWPTVDDAYTDIMLGIDKVVAELRGEDHATLVITVTPEASASMSLPAVNPVEPTLLPYLCDRTAQEDGVASALGERPANEARPLVCIIAGEEDECHAHFQERLHKVFLPDLLSLSAERKVESFYLKWPEATVQGSAQDIFRPLLARDVLRGGNWAVASLETCLKKLAASAPALVSVDLDTQQWNAQTPALIEKFLTFWNECAALPMPWKGPLIVGLFITYQTTYDLKLWQFFARRQREETTNQVRAFLREARWNYPHIQLKVLPELDGVAKADVIELLKSDYVTPAYNYLELINEIAPLYAREDWLKKKDRISMLRLGKKLEEMFPKFRKAR